MEDFKDWIIHQHAPSGNWCCDISDGRPLREDELRIELGTYQVFYSKRHWDDGTDEWISVPPDAILHVPNPVGVVIAWISRGRVYCLSLSGAI
jgi:hypothetical protein